MRTLNRSVPDRPLWGVFDKCLLSLAAVTAFIGCEAGTSVEPQVTPHFAMRAAAPVAHASGGGTVDTSAGRSTYAFHASVNGAGIVEGTVELHFSSADVNIHGNVTCLVIDDNDAWFGAVITRSDRESGNFAVGGDFVWRAEDNGEGADTDPPDQVSSFFGRFAANFCNTQFPVSQKDWTNGNVQIDGGQSSSVNGRCFGQITSGIASTWPWAHNGQGAFPPPPGSIALWIDVFGDQIGISTVHDLQVLFCG